MNYARLVPLLLVAACATAPAPEAVTGVPAEEATFTITQGANTIVTERFRRTAQQLEAELTLPDGGRLQYSAQLRADASVSEMEMRQYAAGVAADAAPTARSTMTFRGDSVHLSMTQGESTQNAQRAVMAGAVPYVNPSPSLMEQIVRRARALGGTQLEVPVLIPTGGGQNANASVTFTADSAQLMLGGTQVRLHVDGQGRVLGGVVPSQGLTLTRTPGR